jgi:hypothetical protein
VIKNTLLCISFLFLFICPTQVFAVSNYGNLIYDWTKAMNHNVGSGVWYEVAGVATDKNGNTFITGYFNKAMNFNFDNPSAAMTTPVGYDIFITKVSSDGSYAWTKFFTGGGSYTRAGGIKTDTNGNIYVIGNYHQAVHFNFDNPDDNTSYATSAITEGFIAKINADGTFGWVKTTVGSGSCSSSALTNYKDIGIDTNNNIYVIGILNGSANFNFDNPGDTPLYSSNSCNGYDSILLKINSNGSFGWTKKYYSTTNNELNTPELSVDNQRNVYLAGNFSGSVDFDPNNPGTIIKTCNVLGGKVCAFVNKIDSSGSYNWTKTITPDADDGNVHVDGLGTDSNRNIIITGNFSAPTNFNFDNLLATPISTGKMYITKINSDGTYSWTNTISADYPQDIAIDPLNNIYITGYFSGTVDFDPSSITEDFRDSGNSVNGWDGSSFLTYYSTDSTYLGTRTSSDGNMTDSYKISIDTNGNIYVGGDVYGESIVDYGQGNDTISGDPDDGDLTLTKFHTPVTQQTPTFSPSNNSSQITYSSSTRVCNDSKPLYTPNLFQINTTARSAKLFFTPLSDTNNYYISFSQNPRAEEHGAMVILSDLGVQNFTVNLLKPNTTYYLKVRGQNGCMPGGWSNILKITTNNKIYYKNYLPSQKKIVVKTTTNIPVVEITPIPTPEIKPQPKPSSIPSITKSCFLWWCW